MWPSDLTDWTISSVKSGHLRSVFCGQPTSVLTVGYLSIDAAAVYASVSTKTIKRWIQAGLPVYQGTRRGKVLIRPSDIDLYLQKKTAPKVDLDAMVNDVLQDLVALERTTTARTASQKLEN